jgi:hypothetical protein
MKLRLVFRGFAITAGFVFAALPAFGQDGEGDRSAYSYIRSITGEATVNSRLNGAVDARRNLPISVGDEISVSQAGRVEIGLADGNVLFLGGGTRAAFDSLSDQQGEQDHFSAIHLMEGEIVLSGVGASAEEPPRVDTDDATIYVARGTHVRVNADSRRGTVVIARAGAAEVRSRLGTYNIKAGQYLMVRGDEEPEIARGTFSRDRFDVWVAERLESVNETQSASVRYVGDQYAGDVASLDGYGDWEYDSAYGGNVWSPRVEADWSPYSNGSWYYTPVGMTWASNDPWGWYPHHYGNWFYARNRWCWAPGYAYSPAWVYWGYSGGYVGWCPTGYYAYASPWWGTYHNYFGYRPHSSLYFAVNGNFASHRVDQRGWNWTNSGNLGTTTARASVIPGSRMGDRLGTQVAISSRPMVVNSREGGVREAIRNYVREAPRTIERANPDSERLAPLLSRERTLPADTVAALRERTVVAERGRLSGPAAAEVAPRGSIVDRSRPATTGSGTTIGRGFTAERSAPDTTVRDRGAVAGGERSVGRNAPRPAGESNWRGRGGAATGETREASPRERAFASENPGGVARPDSWRSRPETPPAQRVIEGAVPGHRAPEARADSWRRREFRQEPSTRENVERVPVERAPSSPPPARIERAPGPQSGWPQPQPRSERPRVERVPYSPPQPHVERPAERPAPAPPQPRSVERAPQPAPQPQQQQPAPRAETSREAPQRPAPNPHAPRGR